MRVVGGQPYSNAQRRFPGPVDRGRRLDDVDRALIEALQRNGRDSFRRIASELGVSEATIRARYRHLCADGIMQVTAVTNPLSVGFGAMAMIGIRAGGSPGEVARKIVDWDEAEYVVITTGQFDLLVEVVCVDTKHLLELTDRIRALDGVVATETFLYLELRKELYDWGTRIEDTGRAGHVRARGPRAAAAEGRVSG